MAEERVLDADAIFAQSFFPILLLSFLFLSKALVNMRLGISQTVRPSRTSLAHSQHKQTDKSGHGPVIKRSDDTKPPSAIQVYTAQYYRNPTKSLAPQIITPHHTIQYGTNHNPCPLTHPLTPHHSPHLNTQPPQPPHPTSHETQSQPQSSSRPSQAPSYPSHPAPTNTTAQRPRRAQR